MKRLLFIAFGIVVLLFSCSNSSNILEGKWSIVDIAQNETDTLSSLTIPLIVHNMKNDEIDYVFFTNDNKYNLVNKKGEIIKTKTYSIKDNLLTIEDKDDVNILEIIKKSDGLINLKSQDNIVLTLQKAEK